MNVRTAWTYKVLWPTASHERMALWSCVILTEWIWVCHLNTVNNLMGRTANNRTFLNIKCNCVFCVQITASFSSIKSKTFYLKVEHDKRASRRRKERGASILWWSCNPLFLLSMNRDELKNCSVNRDWMISVKPELPIRSLIVDTYIEEQLKKLNR